MTGPEPHDLLAVDEALPFVPAELGPWVRRAALARRRRRAASAAAGTVAVTGIVALAVPFGPGGEETLTPAPRATQPAPQPTASPPSDQSPSPVTSSPAAAPAVPGSVLVATETELVRLATTGSESRPLAQYQGRPGPGDEPFGQYVDSLDVSADGRTVYVSVCCEPAAGRVERISANEAAPRPDKAFVSATAPAVSLDGTLLAAIGLTGLLLVDIPTGTITRSLPWPAGTEYATRRSLAWAPDGTTLALLEARSDDPEADAGMRVRVIPASAADLSTSLVFDPPPGQTYAGPAFRGDGQLVLARQPVQTAAGSDAVGVVLDPSDGSAQAEFPLFGRVVEQDYDSTGTYLLTLHDDGTVHWQGAGTDGTLQAKGAIAAAW